jgi:hypothetical protein
MKKVHFRLFGWALGVVVMLAIVFKVVATVPASTVVKNQSTNKIALANSTDKAAVDKTQQNLTKSPVSLELKANARDAVSNKQKDLATVKAAMGKLPLVFEPNVGQTDSRVKFLARSSGYTAFLTGPSSATFAFRADEKKTDVLTMNLTGANASAKGQAEEPTGGVSSYYIGNDPSKWHEKIPNYLKVRYSNVYPGVDIVYQGNDRKLRYDFVVSPGGDPKSIQLSYEGAKNLSLDQQGNLVVELNSGRLVGSKPYIYQEYGGEKHVVDGNYALAAKNNVTFEVGSYDASQALVIDPSNTYASYWGGSGIGNNVITAAAVDSTGVYVAGYSASLAFPGGSTPPAPFPTNDAFISKLPLNLEGGSIYSATYGGTSGSSQFNALAKSGTVVAAVGWTLSGPTFPTVNPIVASPASFNQHGVVVRVTTTSATATASTLIFGDGSDTVNGVAIDSSGNLHITGATSSPLLLTDMTVPSAKPWKSILLSSIGSTNAYYMELSATATAAPIYGSFLGGYGTDVGNAIALDSTGKAYITGTTTSVTTAGGSPLFPTCVNASTSTANTCNFSSFSATAATNPNAGPNPWAADTNAQKHGFVASFNPANSGSTSLVYSELLGGAQPFTTTPTEVDTPNAIAVDQNAAVYVGGTIANENLVCKTNTGTVASPPVMSCSSTVGIGVLGSTVNDNVVFSAPTSPGVVTSVTITRNGTCTVAPTVATFSAPQLAGGITATGTVTTAGVSPNIAVTGITLTSQGSGYTSAPTVSFNGTCSASPSNPTATAAIGTLVVGNITNIGGDTDGFVVELNSFTANTANNPTLSSNGLFGAVAGVETATIKGAAFPALVYATLANGDEINGNGTGVAAVTGNSSVNGLAVDSLDQVYVSGSISNTTERTVAPAIPSQGAIMRRIINANGTMQYDPNTIPAVAVLVPTSFLVNTTASITNTPWATQGTGPAGSGTGAPAVEATGDIPLGPAGAVGGTVSLLQLTAPGTGYNLATTTVTFSGGGCTTEPTATFTLTPPAGPGPIATITLATPGAGCTSPPTVTIADSAPILPGSGATAVAFLAGAGAGNGVGFDLTTGTSCVGGIVLDSLPATLPATSVLIPSSATQPGFNPAGGFSDGIVACTIANNDAIVTTGGSTTAVTPLAVTQSLIAGSTPANTAATGGGGNFPGTGSPLNGQFATLAVTIPTSPSIPVTFTVSAATFSPALAGCPGTSATCWLTTTITGQQVNLFLTSGGAAGSATTADTLDPGVYTATFAITPTSGADDIGIPQVVVVTLNVTGTLLQNTALAGGIPATDPMLTTPGLTVIEGGGSPAVFSNGNTTEYIYIPVTSSVPLLSPSIARIDFGVTNGTLTGGNYTIPSVTNSNALYPVLGTTGAFINVNPATGSPGMPPGTVGCGAPAQSIATYACYIQVAVPAATFNGAPSGTYTGSFLLTAASSVVPEATEGAPVTTSQVPNTTAITFTVVVSAGTLAYTSTGTNVTPPQFAVPAGFGGLVTSAANGGAVKLDASNMLTTVAGTYTAVATPGVSTTFYAANGTTPTCTSSSPGIPASVLQFPASGALPASNTLPDATTPFLLGISNPAGAGGAGMVPGYYASTITVTPAGAGVATNGTGNGTPVAIPVCLGIGNIINGVYSSGSLGVTGFWTTNGAGAVAVPSVLMEAGSAALAPFIYVNALGPQLTTDASQSPVIPDGTVAQFGAPGLVDIPATITAAATSGTTNPVWMTVAAAANGYGATADTAPCNASNACTKTATAYLDRPITLTPPFGTAAGLYNDTFTIATSTAGYQGWFLPGSSCGSATVSGASPVTTGTCTLPVTITSGLALQYTQNGSIYSTVSPPNSTVGSINCTPYSALPCTAATLPNPTFTFTQVVGTSTATLTSPASPNITIATSGTGIGAVTVSGVSNGGSTASPLAQTSIAYGGAPGWLNVTNTAPGSNCAAMAPGLIGTQCIETVSINGAVSSLLPPGTYTATFTLYSSQNGATPPYPPPSVVTETVVLTVTNNPTVTAAPPAVPFTYIVGASGTQQGPQSIGLTANFQPCTGGGTTLAFCAGTPIPIAFTATPSITNGPAGWLSLNGSSTATVSGTLTTTAATPALTVTVNTAGLTVAGSPYNGLITVNIPIGSGNPTVTDPVIQIPVTVTVLSQPVITLTPASQSLTLTSGQSATVPAAATPVALTMTGTDTYTITGAPAWLTVTPSAPLSSNSNTLALAINTASALLLPTGAHTATVTVTGTATESASFTVTVTTSAAPTLNLTTIPTTTVTFGAAAQTVTTSASLSSAPLNPTTLPGSCTVGNYVTVIGTPAITGWLTPASTTISLAGTTAVPLSYTITPDNIGVGTYTAQISCATTSGITPNITSGTNNPLTVTLVIQQPALTAACTPTASASCVSGGLVFNLPASSGSATGAIAVTSVGSAVAFTAVPTQLTGPAGWLTAAGGTTTGTATAVNSVVTVNTAGLAAGTYYGSVAISATNATGAFNIPVTVNIGALTQTGGPVSFADQIAVTTTPQTATIAVSSPAGTGGANVPEAFTVATTGNCTWLTGAVPGTTPATLTLSYTLATANSLGPGTYTCTLSFTATGSTTAAVTTTVTLTVSASPVITATPSGAVNLGPVIFGATGSAASVSATVTLSGSIPSVTYTAVASSSPLTWLSVSPASGNTTANPSLTITATLGSLPAAGTYVGSVVVTNTESSPVQTITIPVVFVVANPTITPSPSSMLFTAVGGQAATAQTISFTSNGGAVSFSATASSVPAGWLTVTPATGSTTATVTVNATAASLTVGTYTGVVQFTLTGANNTTLTVPVTLTVTAPPVCSLSLNSTSATLTVSGTTGGVYLITGGPYLSPQTFTVTATNCPSGTLSTLTATPSAQTWLTVPSVNTTTGVVSFQALSNPHSSGRTATITVSAVGAVSNTFTVSEAQNTNSVFFRQVLALYQQLLGREPDAAGYTYWTTGPGSTLAVSTAGVPQISAAQADDFMTSTEGLANNFQAILFYKALLNRQPVFSEMSTSLAAIRPPAPSTGAATEFTRILGLPEYAADYGAYANTTAGNTAFVNAVYLNLLGRAYNSASDPAYITQLTSGAITPYGVFSAVTATAEFQNTSTFRTATDHSNSSYIDWCYLGFLSRVPDVGGNSFWLGVANSGGSGILYNGATTSATRTTIMGVVSAGSGFIGAPEFQALYQ